jgi:excisionase family DNA binding protein
MGSKSPRAKTLWRASMKTTELTEILTAAQAMEFLQISRNTFYRLIQAGKIPYSLVGQRKRFSRRQLRAMVEGETIYQSCMPK